MTAGQVCKPVFKYSRLRTSAAAERCKAFYYNASWSMAPGTTVLNQVRVKDPPPPKKVQIYQKKSISILVKCPLYHVFRNISFQHSWGASERWSFWNLSESQPFKFVSQCKQVCVACFSDSVLPTGGIQRKSCVSCLHAVKINSGEGRPQSSPSESTSHWNVFSPIQG